MRIPNPLPIVVPRKIKKETRGYAFVSLSLVVGRVGVWRIYCPT